VWKSRSQQERSPQECPTEQLEEEEARQQEMGAEYDDPLIMQNIIQQTIDPTCSGNHDLYNGQEVKKIPALNWCLVNYCYFSSTISGANKKILLIPCFELVSS
jgi:hypothetical protein